MSTFDPVAAFRKAAGSSASKRNPKLPLGHHLLEVEGLTLMPSNNPKHPHAIWFITELRVLESTSEAAPIGSTRSWLTDVDDEVGASNCKRFVLALGDSITEEEASDPTVLAALVADDQPAAGCKLRCTVEKRTSQGGNEYTHFGWEAVVTA